MPAKPTAQQIEDLTELGTISLDAAVQVMFPPTMLPGLIRALTQQKDAHEALFGPIKEAGVQNG